MVKCKRCGLTEAEWKKHEEDFYKEHTFEMEQVDCSSCGQWHVRPIGEEIISVFGKNLCMKCGTSLPSEGSVFEYRNSVTLVHDCRDYSEIPICEVL